MATRSALANDIPSALHAIELADDPGSRVQLGTKLVATLAAQDPTAASTVALALPAGPARLTAIEIATHARLQRDTGDALRWALGISDPTDGDPVRRVMAGELVRQNPRAVMDHLRNLPPSSVRDDLLGYSAGAWARYDVNHVLLWLRELPNDPLRQRLTASVAYEVAQTHPDRAIALAESLPPDRNRWLVLSQIAQTWIAKDPPTALYWATHLPSGPAREAALAGVQTGLGGAVTRTPVSVDATVGNFPNSGTAGKNSAGANSPEIYSPAFSAWLATQPLTLPRDEAIVEFVRQRGAADLGAIGSWIPTLPAGPSRQHAIDVYFDQTLRTSPATAANWLRSLPNSERSDEMVERTVREWIRSDPRAAETWLRETSLPSFRQEELLRHAPR